jgi:NADH dehydrogenase FAD-containing subunit
MNRRDFFRLASMAGIGASAISWSRLASAATPPQLGTVPTNTGISGRVVVIGGGMGGATVAKYLRLWGGTGVSVTLVERDTAYTSNILSNLVLNGQRTITSLQYGYTNLASRYGVRLVKGEVMAIDPVGHSVSLADGSKLPYDRLIIAPGVDFDTIAGLETAAAQAKVPHAWKAGAQTTQLRNMLLGMQPGGVFAMTIPAKPYRCPPGPYERACVVADWLKKNRVGSKVIVLDANPGIIAEPLAFTNAFDVVHKGVIEYHPGVTINSIDATTMSLNTSLGNLKANVINAIPPHKAGKVVVANGLANSGGRWAGVDVLTYQSVVAPGIHIIGDASATTQPKAGHIANQEAKICADAVVRLLAGRSPDPAPITNSACYSPITADTASWLTAVFAYDPGTATMQPVPGAAGEAAGRSTDNYQEMNRWFNTLMEDSFA